jgi:hypothetical protein
VAEFVRKTDQASLSSRARRLTLETNQDHISRIVLRGFYWFAEYKVS